MTEEEWTSLMDKIREHNVVPIIGSRLLVDAEGQSLQSRMAERVLLARNQEARGLPPFRELNEAVLRLKGSVHEPQDLYDYVHRAIRAVTEADDFVIPTPVRQLAQIADFPLFVTLTPDDLLARTLRQRCTVTEIVHSPNLPTSEGKDLPRDWQTRSGEVHVLYLFGKARSAPMFAIHDEDVLEYAHNLIAHGSQVPNAFMVELQQRNLLLIGCNFAEWLSRFFLRATNQKRLSEKDNRAWLIDPPQPEDSLTYFLRSYSRQTVIFPEPSPAAFVAELHRRWMAEHVAGAPKNRTPEHAVPRGTMFFISYSRNTDLPRAESLYQALLNQGVTENEVWFDRRSIEPGHDFGQRILEGIRSCRYFLPLLSRASNLREEGFVFTEWREADERRPAVNRDVFVLPIVVDPEIEMDRYTARPALKWKQDRIDFGHAPEGRPDARLEDLLKKLVRETRRGSDQS